MNERTREENRQAAQMLLSAPARNPELRLLQVIVDEWGHLKGYSEGHPAPLVVWDVLAWAWSEQAKRDAEAEGAGHG
jgi:hypothetical protein